MARVIQGLDADTVRGNVAQARERIAETAALAGRDPSDVELLAAVKYVPLEALGILRRAGLTLLGENRAQDLEAKAAAYPNEFTWDFIGHLQSRKVRQVLPLVRRVHSVGSDSVLRRLGQHAGEAAAVEVLVEVNVAGEEGKSGVAPRELGAFLERCPVAVSGLMTMPPLAGRPEDSRRWFAALRELAARLDLDQLSMGTTQDFEVAVQEGATIVRVGSVLFR